jgi:uncharacterized protein
MKLVVDTNVLFSGIFWLGPPSKILSAWLEDRIHVVASTEIFEEYSRIIKNASTKHPTVNLMELLDLLTDHTEIYQTKNLLHHISRDPDDNKFIACAIEANASYLISGDRDLLDISEDIGVKIIKPRNFVEKFSID